MTLVSGFEKIVRTSEPIAHRTWLKIGGPAAFFAEPKSVDQLAALVRRCREEDVPIRILGGGSNVLVRDDGVPGMVLSLASGDFAEISIRGNQLTAGGGAKLAHAISESVRAGLAGLEPLVGIPGSIGGALHGNSGSRAGDIGQWACRATVMTRAGEIFQRDREDLVFAYRQSSLDELVILSADFLLEEDDPEQLTKRMQKQWIVKKAGQPLVASERGLGVQESSGDECRYAHRSSRTQGYPCGCRRSEPATCQLYRCWRGRDEPGCAAADRYDPQSGRRATWGGIGERAGNLVISVTSDLSKLRDGVATQSGMALATSISTLPAASAVPLNPKF